MPEMKPSTLDAVTAMPAASELCTCAAHEEESCNVIAISDCDSEQESALLEAKLFDRPPPHELLDNACKFGRSNLCACLDVIASASTSLVVT